MPFSIGEYIGACYICRLVCYGLGSLLPRRRLARNLFFSPTNVAEAQARATATVVGGIYQPQRDAGTFRKLVRERCANLQLLHGFLVSGQWRGPMSLTMFFSFFFCFLFVALVCTFVAWVTKTPTTGDQENG